MDSCKASADERERSNEIEVAEESSCTLESVHAEGHYIRFYVLISFKT